MGMALGFGLSGDPAACVTRLTLWLAGEVRADVGVDELGGRVEYEVLFRQIPAPTASEVGDESGRRVTAAQAGLDVQERACHRYGARIIAVVLAGGEVAVRAVGGIQRPVV